MFVITVNVNHIQILINLSPTNLSIHLF